MKKFMALLLAVSMCLSFCSCSNDKKAFEVSKSAYNNINDAYSIIDVIWEDVYEAWRLGGYNAEDVKNRGIAYLLTELSLTEDELRAGFKSDALHRLESGSEEISDELKESFKKWSEDADTYLKNIRTNQIFGVVIHSVIYAHIEKGSVSEAQSALNAAKENMKELSEKYSDYEHYPNLKGFYTTTSAFLELCIEPDISFNQFKEVSNEYKKEARDYINDLDFIFD